jgi:hypothetical protein
MRVFALTVLLIMAAGCSTGIVVHDQTRAAELIVDFLTSLKSAEGIQLAYAWTDDRYKQEITAAEFTRIVARMRNLNQGAEIRLTGYETIGPVEILNIYASSSTDQGKLYFRFVLSGSKSSDYYLLNLDVNDSTFSQQGIYHAFAKSIAVSGV